MSVILLPAILLQEMAAPILWAPGIFGSFCREASIEVILGLGGRGGSANFLKRTPGFF